jgi:alanine dehydrogenase
MRIGVPREIKPDERRVALTPGGARELVSRGHDVSVEASAGDGAGFPNDAYLDAGAAVTADGERLWHDSELVLKVKEPVGHELELLHERLTLFTYLHLAANRALTEALLRSGTTAIGYETVEDAGSLPLLLPMSEIAGRLAAEAAAHHLQQPHGGPGVLIGGAPGVAPARVLVIGGGAVGTEAAAVASGMGADVTVVERSLDRVRFLLGRFAGAVRVLASDGDTRLDEARAADVCIGAVLVPGRSAPRLLGRADLRRLRPGCVLVDVAIDQGGCFETSRPTTHADPTFVEEGVLHYCVANMPSAVAVTATRALAHATLPYMLELADAGSVTPRLGTGLNVAHGRLVHPGVAAAFRDLPGTAPDPITTGPGSPARPSARAPREGRRERSRSASP